MQETSYDAITALAPLEESCGQSGAILYGTTMGNVGAIPMKTIHKALECAGAHTSPLELDEESTVLTMAGGVWDWGPRLWQNYLVRRSARDRPWLL